MRHPLSAAAELFLRTLLRGYFDASALAAAQVQAEQPEFDWPRVLRVAVDEALAPFLQVLLQEQGWAPLAVQQELRQAYIDSALRNALLWEELSRVLRLLAQAGIPAILLKGAAVAETVYGNVAVRPMRDLDLLLSPEQINDALIRLQAIGYRLAAPEVAAGAGLIYENEILLGKADSTQTALELHWSLIDSPHYQRILDMAWFWQSRRPVTIAGTPAWVLGPEAQLLHLCAHLALHHRGRGLLWQMDIVALLHALGDQIDWELVLTQAAACDLVLALRRTLGDVIAGWSAPVPAPIWQRLATMSPSPAEQRAVAWLTAAERPVAQRFWADLASLPTWPARLRFARLHLFPTAAYMRRRYAISHPALLPVYYLYRWYLGARSWLVSW